MSLFEGKKIFLDEITVAEQLRSTRQKQKLRLSEVSKKIKISFKYLNSLEKGRYEELPEGVYCLNFLKEYAIFLGLNYKKILEQFLKEKEVYQSQNQKKLFVHEIVRRKYLRTVPDIIKKISIVVATLLCLIYLGSLVRNIFVPPALFLATPLNNTVTTNNKIIVEGVTDAETEVLINSDLIMVDSKGNFSEEINLKQGINNIIVTAKNNNQRTIIERQVLLKSSED